MPIEGFDYKAFAADLANQASEILKNGGNAAPEGISDADKKNITDTVRKFCYMSGEALSNDPQIKFNAQQAMLVTQFIGEWTFHKSIDLIIGKIPVQFREGILQIIAANIFNTAKLAIIKKMKEELLINLIEEKVKQVYSSELEKLVKKGAISPQQFEMAVNKSNLKDFVQKTEDEVKLNNIAQETSVSAPNDKKVLKIAALAMLLKRMPQDKAETIIASLNKNDAAHVVNYMKMSNIEEKIDHQIIINALEEIRKLIPPSREVNVPRLLQKHYKLIRSASPKKLSALAMGEREAVKNFILDKNFPAQNTFSAHVIKSLVNSVEKKINDN